MENNEIKREFWLSSFSVNNSTSVFIIMLIIMFGGILAYKVMPKSQFPDLVLPMMYVNTVYPGNSPVDIENLITRHIEKELKTVKGVKKITSTSAQDVSAVMIEFNEDVEIPKALQDTKDAVDKAKSELPNDLPSDPQVLEMDFSEIPVMNINLSGDFEVDKLKKYAEYLEDKIEALSEVSRIEITGALDREIQINADLAKMDAMKVTFGDIEGAIGSENITMAGGEILTNGFRRSLRISGEFKTVKDIEEIVVKSEEMNTIYLKDIAQVKDAYVERKSFARLANENFLKQGFFPVVAVNVIKKSGENLVDAEIKIKAVLEDAKKNVFPDNLNITITNNQADDMRLQLDNLENSIISGVILVVLVLLFFMGLRNSLFVGVAIPLSMMMSFMVLAAFGVTINIVILFALILALGMLVDNAIVVIENIYRLMEQGMTPMQAAKEGTGEVAVPIISSTATTLAAFLPLIFWDGILGEFMKYMPITLIVVLSCSLFVGLVINPVLAGIFMKLKDPERQKRNQKRLPIIGGILVALAIPSYFIFDTYSIANLLMTFGVITLANVYFLTPAANWFQEVFLVWFENFYKNQLRFALTGKRPYAYFAGTVFFFIFSILLFGANSPLVVLFPPIEPPYIYMYLEAPLGTDVNTMNQITTDVEKKVFKILEPYAPAISSVVTNIGEGTANPNEGRGVSFTPHKARITVGFVAYEKRQGINSNEVYDKLSKVSNQLAGVKLSMGKEDGGPPVGKPVSIEVTGDDYLTLIEEAEKIKNKIEKANISGLEGLKIELEIGKPELLFNIDRAKARRFGTSTFNLASSLRTSVYGKEIGKFKDGNDDYPIQLRLADSYRYNLSSLVDQRITFRDNRGNFHQIPVSSIASLEYGSSFGSVKRKDLEKLVVVSAGVLAGYNPNQIVEQVKASLANHEIKDRYTFRFGGEQEEQAKSMAFLANALLVALALITLILVAQFNSIVQPFIIMGSVLFSTIGVFLGLTIFKMDFSIIMTGIGIISLAGIVVNNAIVLIDFTNLTRERRRQDLGLKENEFLPQSDFIDCLVEAGFTRLRPVLLTAITTVLGLVPLATGFNIDFFGLYARFEPNIYSGGLNAAYWGPMAWTVVFGLTFATFLTLILVPVMYLLTDKLARIGQRFA